MFKVLVLRELYALSDAQVEYQIADRLSFQRFLGIDLTQDAPDYTAIWRFRERFRQRIGMVRPTGRRSTIGRTSATRTTSTPTSNTASSATTR